MTEVSGRVAGLFYACRFPNQENTKFCVVQVDIENSVIKTDASTQSSFKGVLSPKKKYFFAFIYKILRDNFGTASGRTSQSDFKNELFFVTCHTC